MKIKPGLVCKKNKNNFEEFTFKQIPEETETVKKTEPYFSEQFKKMNRIQSQQTTFDCIARAIYVHLLWSLAY